MTKWLFYIQTRLYLTSIIDIMHTLHYIPFITFYFIGIKKKWYRYMFIINVSFISTAYCINLSLNANCRLLMFLILISKLMINLISSRWTFHLPDAKKPYCDWMALGVLMSHDVSWHWETLILDKTKITAINLKKK